MIHRFFSKFFPKPLRVSKISKDPKAPPKAPLRDLKTRGRFQRLGRSSMGVGVAAVVGGGLLIGIGLQWMHRREARAAQLMEQGWQLMQQHKEKHASASPSDPADPVQAAQEPPPTPPDDTALLHAARLCFEGVVHQMGYRSVGVVAALKMADVYAQLGDRIGAQDTFQKVRQALKPTDSLYFLATQRYAALREDQGDVAGALAAFSDLAHNDQLFYADYAQFEQARLYMAQKDMTQARRLWEHIQKTFPGSSLADEVKAQLVNPGLSAASLENAPLDSSGDGSDVRRP